MSETDTEKFDGFGLVPIKEEGVAINLETGIRLTEAEKAEYCRINRKAEWIEIYYDSEDYYPEPIFHEVSSIFEEALKEKVVSKDDIYKLITALANKFIEKGGF